MYEAFELAFNAIVVLVMVGLWLEGGENDFEDFAKVMCFAVALCIVWVFVCAYVHGK